MRFARSQITSLLLTALCFYEGRKEMRYEKAVRESYVTRISEGSVGLDVYSYKGLL